MTSPIQESPINYESYLKIQELLSLQQLLSEHPDEMLFILIHQIYELWFKEVIHELEGVVACFQKGDIHRSIKTLNRIITIQKVLVTQIDVLETMTPSEFAEFRDNLRPASGFQSIQFRELEFLSGLKNPYFLQAFAKMPGAAKRLEARMAEATVYDYFLRLLAGQGFAIDAEVLERDTTKPYVSNPSVLKAVETIYKNPSQYYELYMLCEALLSYDENFNLWRYRHVKMVERTIGGKMGTGGSSGAKYLTATLEGRFFPELWEVRSLIGSY